LGAQNILYRGSNPLSEALVLLYGKNTQLLNFYASGKFSNLWLKALEQGFSSLMAIKHECVF
jgi:hypothetical protein